MNSFKFSAVAFTIAALGTSALAQNAVGTWNGHIEMGKLPIPPDRHPSIQYMVAIPLTFARLTAADSEDSAVNGPLASSQGLAGTRCFAPAGRVRSR